MGLEYIPISGEEDWEENEIVEDSSTLALQLLEPFGSNFNPKYGIGAQKASFHHPS